MSVTKTLAGLFTLLFVGLASAQPAKVEANKSRQPVLGELPEPPKPNLPPAPMPRSPDAPRPLALNSFRLFWINDYTSDIPVRWTITPMDLYANAGIVDIPKGSPVVGILEGTTKAGKHYPPADAASAVAVWGEAKGLVLLQADGVKDNQIVTLVRVIIDVAGTGVITPPPGGGNPPGGGDPPGGGTPPVVTTKYQFMIVRPNGPASPEFVKAFSDPAWDELKAAGHSVKEYTLAESVAVYTPPAGSTFPIPYTVTIGTAEGKSKVVAGPVAMPTDSAGIRKLLEGLPK